MSERTWGFNSPLAHTPLAGGLPPRAGLLELEDATLEGVQPVVGRRGLVRRRGAGAGQLEVGRAPLLALGLQGRQPVAGAARAAGQRQQQQPRGDQPAQSAVTVTETSSIGWTGVPSPGPEPPSAPAAATFSTTSMPRVMVPILV